MYGTTYGAFRSTSNGLVMLFVDEDSADCFTSYTSEPFPVGDLVGHPVLSPYWGDSDFQASGSKSWFESGTGPSPIDSLLDIVSDRWVILTYDTVGYFSENNDRVNTMQTVIAASATESRVCFLYPGPESGLANGGLDWTAGDVSGGTGGLGGDAAQVGFDVGDGINFFAIPD